MSIGLGILTGIAGGYGEAELRKQAQKDQDKRDQKSQRLDLIASLLSNPELRPEHQVGLLKEFYEATGAIKQFPGLGNITEQSIAEDAKANQGSQPQGAVTPGSRPSQRIAPFPEVGGPPAQQRFPSAALPEGAASQGQPEGRIPPIPSAAQGQAQSSPRGSFQGLYRTPEELAATKRRLDRLRDNAKEQADFERKSQRIQGGDATPKQKRRGMQALRKIPEKKDPEHVTLRQADGSSTTMTRDAFAKKVSEAPGGVLTTPARKGGKQLVNMREERDGKSWNVPYLFNPDTGELEEIPGKATLRGTPTTPRPRAEPRFTPGMASTALTRLSSQARQIVEMMQFQGLIPPGLEQFRDKTINEVMDMLSLSTFGVPVSHFQSLVREGSGLKSIPVPGDFQGTLPSGLSPAAQELQDRHFPGP